MQFWILQPSLLMFCSNAELIKIKRIRDWLNNVLALFRRSKESLSSMPQAVMYVQYLMRKMLLATSGMVK
jgi:hypothetical protein